MPGCCYDQEVQAPERSGLMCSACERASLPHPVPDLSLLDQLPYGLHLSENKQTNKDEGEKEGHTKRPAVSLMALVDHLGSRASISSRRSSQHTDHSVLQKTVPAPQWARSPTRSLAGTGSCPRGQRTCPASGAAGMQRQGDAEGYHHQQVKRCTSRVRPCSSAPTQQSHEDLIS